MAPVPAPAPFAASSCGVLWPVRGGFCSVSFDRSVSVHLSFVCFAARLILWSEKKQQQKLKNNKKKAKKNLGAPRRPPGKRQAGRQAGKWRPNTTQIQSREPVFSLFSLSPFFLPPLSCSTAAAAEVADAATVVAAAGPTTSGRHFKDGCHKHKIYQRTLSEPQQQQQQQIMPPEDNCQLELPATATNNASNNNNNVDNTHIRHKRKPKKNYSYSCKSHYNMMFYMRPKCCNYFTCKLGKS